MKILETEFDNIIEIFEECQYRNMSCEENCPLNKLLEINDGRKCTVCSLLTLIYDNAEKIV